MRTFGLPLEFALHANDVGDPYEITGIDQHRKKYEE
jgi:hypothetical protein